MLVLACAQLGSTELAVWMEDYVRRSECREDVLVNTALIDMYAKCGAVELALEVFTGLRARNTCTWNAMINGLAMNGYSAMALDMFRQMERDGRVVPD